MVSDLPVVIFDLDDTLIADVAARDAAVRQIADLLDAPSLGPTILENARRCWRGTHCRQLPAMTGVSSWEALWTDFGTERADIADEGQRYRLRVWQETLDGLGRRTDITAEELDVQYARIRRSSVVPVSGAVDVLSRLAATHQLWLATHGSSSLQREKLSLLGMTDLFGEVFISGEIGSTKASPPVVNLIQKRLRRNGLSVCGVIGDSIESDMALARAGSWPGIHLCSGQLEESCRRAVPDATHINDLAQVLLPCADSR
ncbi:HAD family hydrolase [Nocardia salmonicida]|uniref:HAD family hydrolase n=1 Tax=Nocardia salmonicida TaxID=53431 RepID=UPI0007A41C66|nr:HAD family hydrolase [Nocardia salmonicida]MBC7299428.1 HAD family hydrolase [Nocardia sp.]